MSPGAWGIHDAQSDIDKRPTGCGFYRLIVPLEGLRGLGWKVGYAAGRPPADASEADVIVGQRFDRPEVLSEWRRLRARHKLVYEIDDNVFEVDPLNTGAHRNFRQASKRDTVRHCAEVSDLVTVTTEPLAKIMREFNPNVAVLNNCVPSDILQITRPRREHLVVGWAGGWSHARDILTMAEPLRRFMERDCKESRLHMIGSDFRPMIFSGLYRTRYTPWECDHRKYWANMDFDIGLAPLSSHPFNESKSHVKALEYAGLGIPVIASDSVPYRDFVMDGVTGFLCRTPKQWRDRLNLLARDEGLRESMGAKAKELAASWTIEARAHLWDQAYRSIL